MTFKEPKISIVMPSYNCERFIGEAIESVISQSYKKWELIIVDDCSQDNTAAVAKKYASLDERIELIENEENLKVSKTRNKGIKLASGDYIALLDCDDVWTDDKLYKQLLLADESGADIIYCSYDFIDEDGKHIKRPFIVPKTTDFESMLISSVMSCSTVLIKSELLKQHPFRSDIYHEDYALWMELLSIPVKAAGVIDVLMHYRQVSNSRSSSKKTSAINRWYIYRNVLGLGLIKSISVFIRYAFKGMMKYR